MEHRGIPNTYNSQRFRSLVEARWASFFDELGWPWEYEPFELKGYIPDFILKFPKPLLVEVKYEMSLEKLDPHKHKIATSGWDGECLIVGASLFPAEVTSGGPGTAIGLLGCAHAVESPNGFLSHDPMDAAAIHRCGGEFSINQAWMNYSCRRHEEDHWKEMEPVPFKETVALWRTASNRTQWKRR
jgi:hypothetical protein